ncbi:TetR/AcrR family transcriptional regulator [Microbacterium sp.]|uniref:TetR/AcrR family transcriptional regulator n=1 Tax=Microbacterium sp. TaxID=51671 RepID=UPI00260C790F|nr:TetR/AcrR family transcriptional regulator [Microbacterium sp.]
MTDTSRLSTERRDALTAATVAEFARAGYEGASLNRIIRDAGMSKSSFYHFVGSKDELFDAVVRMLIADVAAQWTLPAPEEFAASFWQRVDALLSEFGALSATAELQHLGRIFYLPGATGDGAARTEFLDAVHGWVRSVLQVGRDNGHVRDDLPLDLQADVTFAVLRAIDEWVLAEGDPSERAGVAASAPGLVLRRLLAVAES